MIVERLAMAIKLFVIDVDGTMTDGSIYYDENGNELKCFNTKDAAGFKAASNLGIEILVMTGRECQATLRRMKDLGVTHLFQNITDKKSCLECFMDENGISKNEVVYLGDDLNDLEAMSCAGLVACPSDSCREVREISGFVSIMPGGHGAVRDIIESLLRKDGLWEDAIKNVYGVGK